MISANVVVDAMSSHEWVQRLPRQHIEKLAKLAEEKDFELGDVLFHQGDRADLFYVIVSGTVGMKLALPSNANSLIAQVVIAGEEIGWDAFIGEGVRCFTAKAMTPVRALVFNGRALGAECECDPQFGVLLMKQLLRVVSERLNTTRLQHLIRS
jgi:CRP-like cAMP-binding protein